MLTGIHVLLTYRCTHECDHCFLSCGPGSPGTFTAADLSTLLDQAADLGTIEEVWFEGGEPFLYHPLLVFGVRESRARGFEVGAVTNGYWAETPEDAELWLRPLVEAGLGTLAVSDDEMHWGPDEGSPAARARQGAERLGLSAFAICVPSPTDGDGVVFRGRAADKLTDGVPRQPAESFGAECPESLAEPGRVHVDAFGHVHVCQGVSMGNFKETPLPGIVEGWDAARDPICGPILEGGPFRLAEAEGLEHEATYASICHFCYRMREALLERYPDRLTPPGVYGRPREPSEDPDSRG